MLSKSIKEAHLKTLIKVTLTHSHLKFEVPNVEISVQDRILDLKVYSSDAFRKTIFDFCWTNDFNSPRQQWKSRL